MAAREASHGDTFCRRISELGYELRVKTDPKAAAKLARYANPKISDLEKIGPDRDRFEAENRAFFADTDAKIASGYYDEMTCNLMQWYITEEKDSAKRLRDVYDCVRDKAGMGDKKAKSNGHTNGAEMAMLNPSADAEAIMAGMTAGFKSLEKSIDKLAKAAAR